MKYDNTRESRTEDDRLTDRFTETPAQRRARIERRRFTQRERFVILAALMPSAGEKDGSK